MKGHLVKKIRFIGDVHGKYNRYKKLIKDVPVSMQVGDMGVGFRGFSDINSITYLTNPPFDSMEKGDHHYIRGNHDNPGACKQQKHWIPDGTVHNGVFCSGGAASIDRAWRTEGLDWWEDEELSYSDAMKVFDSYTDSKPRYVMTHDCPPSISDMLVKSKMQLGGVTTNLMGNMFEAHKPELWIFGHWHTSFDKVVLGTRFICLNELEHIDLEIEEKRK